MGDIVELVIKVHYAPVSDCSLGACLDPLEGCLISEHLEWVRGGFCIVVAVNCAGDEHVALAVVWRSIPHCLGPRAGSIFKYLPVHGFVLSVGVS